jgi:hypothetical protein
MLRWAFVALLALQAHFAASYLVPLDDQAQRTFGGLLRWVWPWAIGDGGPLGRVTSSGFPIAGFFLAVTAAGVLIAGALAVARLWVPFDWWRWLAISGALLSLLLMASFFGPTKLLPITTGVAIVVAALGYWPAVTRVL